MNNVCLMDAVEGYGRRGRMMKPQALHEDSNPPIIYTVDTAKL